MKKYRLADETSIQVYFEKQWVQVATVSRTTWMYPDQRINVRFFQATEDIGQEIVDALNEKADQC